MKNLCEINEKDRNPFLKKRIGNFELIREGCRACGEAIYVGDLDDDGSLEASFLVGENGFFLRFEVTYYGSNYAEYYGSIADYRIGLSERLADIYNCNKNSDGEYKALKDFDKTIQAVTKMLNLFEEEYNRLALDYYHINWNKEETL